MPNLINNLEEKKEININIPLKGEKTISTKNFYNLSFYFYDYITVDKTKNYLIVYIFDQLHVYKIKIQKYEILYTKIKIQNFSVNRRRK